MYLSNRVGIECGFSSSGRAPPCQGGGSEFEPRNPLQIKTTTTAVVVVFCRHLHLALQAKNDECCWALICAMLLCK